MGNKWQVTWKRRGDETKQRRERTENSLYQRRLVNSAHARRWLMLSQEWKKRTRDWESEEEIGRVWWRCLSSIRQEMKCCTQRRDLFQRNYKQGKAADGRRCNQDERRVHRESKRGEKKTRNYSSMVQITAGRLSGPLAITIMTTWCDMIVTALIENHSPRLGWR